MTRYQYFISLFVDLNEQEVTNDIDIQNLVGSRDTPTITSISVTESSNTHINIQTTCNTYISAHSEYKSIYNCNVYYVCFS